MIGRIDRSCSTSYLYVMEIFSIDESGYTGFDLLNKDQRFQGAAAISISDEEARRLIDEYFPNLQASELKYGALARRARNRERLLKLQRDALANHKCVTYICDKRYLLILMFLNYATEPWYFQRGINFYENGNNYAMGSLLYHIGPRMLGEEDFNAILAAFQRAAKEKAEEAIRELVLRVKSSNWESTLPEALGPIARASPECVSAIATLGVSTDAAIVVLGSIISRLEMMAEAPYQIEHDQSKNLLQYSTLLRSLINHEEPIEFRQSKIARIKFPLKLEEVTQVDSKDSPSVQIADVLIGAAVAAASTLAGNRQADVDPEKVFGLYRDEQFIHLVPSLDFEEQRRFREGSQGAQLIDYFSRHFVQ